MARRPLIMARRGEILFREVYERIAELSRVARAHPRAEGERVVESHSDYVVVEKVRDAAEYARRATTRLAEA